MGQDSEEAAEFIATVRTCHVVMKEWYTNGKTDNLAALKNKYGPYPSMWKEVLNWPGWKEVRKEYLRSEQQKDSGNAPASTGAVPRKRKSRWGSATSAPANNDGAAKRFAPSSAPQQNSAPRVMLPTMSGNNNLTPQQQQELRNMQSQLRTVNDRLSNLERDAARVDALPRGHRDRSPSPPPIYGADGKRKNTRVVRWRERYTSERQDLLESIMRLSSKGAPPGAGGPLAGGMGHLPGAHSLLVRKRVKKIRIPVEEHPNYNFIGLIIGPRGKTQKELEAKTGCKIAIRGRGSVKEGARGRRDGKVTEGDNEPLHVVISGDDQRAVDAASDMVEQMLVVIDDEKNIHKQQQLRELALLNGTLKEEDAFSRSAERFMADRKGTGMGGAGAVPPTDFARARAAGTTGASGEKIDSEYLSFMAELDGKKAPPAPPAEKPSEDNNLPPPPAAGGPPPPPDLPPPPTGAMPPNPPGPSPPKHPPAPNGNPGIYGPPGNPPRPPQQQYGHYDNQQYGGGGYQQHQQQQQYGHYQQQNHQQQPHQQGAAQVKPGEEAAAWDPSSYYGNNSGAGGFNWWEQ